MVSILMMVNAYENSVAERRKKDSNTCIKYYRKTENGVEVSHRETDIDIIEKLQKDRGGHE